MFTNEFEICDEVNDSLKLIQRKAGLKFGTDALLLAGYIKKGYKSGIELGAGTGIISMLLLSRDKVQSAECLEIQPKYAELIKRNAELNRLSDRLTSVAVDLRDYNKSEAFDLCYSNPPYMKTTSGKPNCEEEKQIARHEVAGDIFDFVKKAGALLKYGGTFAVVYRPDRLSELMRAMSEANLEAKRMTFVHANEKSEPSMLLIEAKKGGKCGLKVTRPLIIYKNKENKEYTEDMQYVTDNGYFPRDFER